MSSSLVFDAAIERIAVFPDRLDPIAVTGKGTKVSYY
jgi:hypothetical protein